MKVSEILGKGLWKLAGLVQGPKPNDPSASKAASVQALQRSSQEAQPYPPASCVTLQQVIPVTVDPSAE